MSKKHFNEDIAYDLAECLAPVSSLCFFDEKHTELAPATSKSDFIEIKQKWVATFIWLSMTYFPGIIQKIHATVQSPTTWLQRAFIGYINGMSPIS